MPRATLREQLGAPLPVPGPRGPEPRALTHLHQLKVVGVEDTQVLDGDLIGQQLFFFVVVHHLKDHIWREKNGTLGSGLAVHCPSL